MITKTKLFAFNELQNTPEYATRSTNKIYEWSGITGEELSIIEDGIQNIDMIIKGVVSKSFKEKSIEKLKNSCNEEVLDLFLKAIEEKKLDIVTKFSTRAESKNLGIWGLIKKIFT